ncbi:protein fluG-like [Cryptomeria japonica]|uniref:protein fluG-like n=1 Tax=Cryptomeria japonica TaxID=3369 RepID=UPI0027DA330E|nr:protein fluG-like [Cryptomeria japonica]
MYVQRKSKVHQRKSKHIPRSPLCQYGSHGGTLVVDPFAVAVSIVGGTKGGAIGYGGSLLVAGMVPNPPDGMTWTLGEFTNLFLSTLKSLSKDVVGFKSIAAYHSGLNINPLVTSEEADDGLHKDLHASVPIRIRNKSFVDYIFTCSLEVAASSDLPMQIHIGFGDTDLDLRHANLLHLQPILEDDHFKNCHIVLLHTSYPYSKEASYLSSVYPQVFLDFSLGIPKLSVYGMCSAIKELLELAPLNKVMFNTDGYAFPETFYLGTKWAREVITSVLLDACDGGDLSIQEAIETTQKILRGNAINFYKLDEDTTQIMKSKVVNVAADYHTQYLEMKEGTVHRLPKSLDEAVIALKRMKF